MQRTYSLNTYLHETFGAKLYKLALDGGFTCPNRDGTVGSRGCIFCSGRGSGDFAEPVGDDVRAAIDRAKARVAHKNPGGKYIAYFQSFTSTYAPVERLERLFTQAISHPDVAALSVATRPDCLGDEVVADYRAGKFTLPDLDEYLRLLALCVELLPPDMVIHRLTGDGAKRDLIAPLWSADKKRVLNTINRYFDEHDVIQGKLYTP